MKKMQKNVCFIVLVVVLTGTATTFIRVQGSVTFDGTVEDCSDNALSGVVVTLFDYYLTSLGSDTTDSSGDYSFDVTLNGNSPYLLTASKTRFTTGMKWVASEGTNDFELVGNGEKIGVFFWASDAGREIDIDDYIDQLETDEGYTKFYKFENSSDVASDCATVDAYEIDADTIFVYIYGHGYNSGGHSYTSFMENGSSIASNTFRGYMDLWEANRKCILVESCYSGDWADDFAAAPYLAISTSDETHPSVTYNSQPTPYEGKFSHYFFIRIGFDDTASEAYDNTEPLIYNPYQYPKISDYSTYDWFD